MRKPSIAARAAGGAALLMAGAAALAKVQILGYWWENPLPLQETPRGLTSIRAEQCGVCHQEIYREWQASSHAAALSDRQFRAEMAKDPQARWLCLNCHTPLENQLATITVGVKGTSVHQPVRKKNARFDPKLASEGVTCAVCHVRDGVVLGPWGDSSAPHPVRRDPKLLNEQICEMCHEATAAYTDVLVCTFDTAGEWRASPYAARGQPCAHCHMPAVERAVAAGSPVRASRRHLFLGSKIPKEATLPDSQRGYFDLHHSGIEVDVAGGPTAAKLRVKNANAGHMLPTGDPERFILVKTELLDAAGQAVARDTYRIGQKWVWHPKARKLGDNRLKPLEEREVSLPAAPGVVKARVTVENWRMSEENAAYHKLGKNYPRSAVVLRLEKTLR